MNASATISQYITWSQTAQVKPCGCYVQTTLVSGVPCSMLVLMVVSTSLPYLWETGACSYITWKTDATSRYSFLFTPKQPDIHV